MELCCGGILGMGETLEQRLDFAFELRELGPGEVPINFLNPRPGTPLAGRTPLGAHEALQAIALFRLVLPDRIIRSPAAASWCSASSRPWGWWRGVNGLIVGNYLTTAGRPAAEDVRLAADLGMDVVAPNRTGAPAR